MRQMRDLFHLNPSVLTKLACVILLPPPVWVLSAGNLTLHQALTLNIDLSPNAINIWCALEYTGSNRNN